MTTALRVGVAWSTSFDRPFYQRLHYPKLRYAYRAPSFVAHAVAGSQHELSYMLFDEQWLIGDFDGSAASRSSHVDLLYITTHGHCSNGIYRVATKGGEWPPVSAAFGSGGPGIAVFDTCNLV